MSKLLATKVCTPLSENAQIGPNYPFSLPGVMWVVSVTMSQEWMGAGVLNVVLSLSLSHTSHWKINMAPHVKECLGYVCKPCSFRVQGLHTDHSMSIRGSRCTALIHAFTEELSRWPGSSAMIQQLWRRDVTFPFPPSGNEGYIRNRDVPYQSVTPSRMTDELGFWPKRHRSCPFQQPV